MSYCSDSSIGQASEQELEQVQQQLGPAAPTAPLKVSGNTLVGLVFGGLLLAYLLVRPGPPGRGRRVSF